MKIEKPIYAVRILTTNGNFINEYALYDTLRTSLRAACSIFMAKTDNHSSSDLPDVAQELAVSERIAISQYLTGIKIQNFANNAAVNDNITLEKEINDFLKQFNKLTK